MYGYMHLCMVDNAQHAHMFLCVPYFAAKCVHAYKWQYMCVCVCVRALGAPQSVRICVAYQIRFKASSLFEPPSKTADHTETVHVRNAAQTASMYI